MTIFVANFGYRITVSDLTTLFSEYGEVTNPRIIRDKVTRRSKGFGFVEMDDECGRRAIEALNGKDYFERPLSVTIANEREEQAAPRPEPDANVFSGFDDIIL